MEIETQIRQFICKHLYYDQDDSLTEDTSFLEAGIIDSMGVMELVAFVEQTFHFRVQQQDVVVENFDSIRALAGYIERKLATAGLETPMPAAQASHTAQVSAP